MVLAGGMVAADVAYQESDPAAGDEGLQDDLLDAISSGYSITAFVPFVLIIAAILAAAGLFTRL